MRRILAPSVLLVSASVLSGCVVATSSRSTGGGVGLLFFFLPFVLLLLMARTMRGLVRGGPAPTRRRPVVERPVPELDVDMIRAELSVLADDVVRLEPQVAVDERARDDYEAGAHRYRVVSAALDQTGGRVDLVRLQRLVDEANASMARARAVLQGGVRRRD